MPEEATPKATHADLLELEDRIAAREAQLNRIMREHIADVTAMHQRADEIRAELGLAPAVPDLRLVD